MTKTVIKDGIFRDDDFENIRALPDFDKKIETVRSHKVSVSIVMQNILQLEGFYGKESREAITGNHQIRV